MSKKPEYIVSACLAGYNCRYDGTSFTVEKVKLLVESGEGIPVCPEQMVGLPAPRGQCEIVSSGETVKVLSINGEDYTEEFFKGANLTLQLAETRGIKKAILKSRSPSCGCGEIYDGTFSGRRIEGNGITAELLLKNGIKVYNESYFTDSTE